MFPALLVLIIGVAGCGSCSSASKSDPPALHVVSLGDSISVGGEDCGQCGTYTDLFGAWVQKTTGRRVVSENLSQHDSPTARMADELPQESGQSQVVESADVVLLDIGFNDTPWNSVDDAGVRAGTSG